tara:strand:+ start:25 stop:780 length:756 start_codon:yes stop_codon:yes gene_type:complete
MKDFNRVALVSGAAQGIGFACAEALSDDGFFVVLADINEDAVHQAAANFGNSATGICVDMSDTEAILNLFDIVETKFGPVEILVNNAGQAKPGDFLTYEIDAFDAVINLNLRGPFITTQRAARSMIERKIEGSIINMSSINAQLAIPNIPAYCASKGGLMQLTKAAALALAQFNIRVNAVGPGSINTEMLAGVNSDPLAMQTVLSRTPIKRLGDAKEVADVVAFLASKKASYITGETIYVDGGRLGLNYLS